MKLGRDEEILKGFLLVFLCIGQIRLGRIQGGTKIHVDHKGLPSWQNVFRLEGNSNKPNA